MAYLGMFGLALLAVILRRTNWVFALILACNVVAMVSGIMSSNAALHVLIVAYCAAYAAATAATLGADKPRLWPQAAPLGAMV